MNKLYMDYVRSRLSDLKKNGLFKTETSFKGPQGAQLNAGEGNSLLNFCSNNYLGLSNHPRIVQAAKDGLDQWGYGMSSVRFICGTQTVHKELEECLSDFLQTEDTILYSSCFDANGGLFETLLEEEDVVISDKLNHASIIDGIRLCKARKVIYENRDMADLEQKLKETQSARFRLIATDGVFSMDGTLAPLKEITQLARRYHALVMVDDSHGIGVLGAHGKGLTEHCELLGEVDLITGTLGKALGGASGGFTSGRKEIIELLRQRSRPYLFSNSLSPVIAAASLEALKMMAESTELVQKLQRNIHFFKECLARNGLQVPTDTFAIIPIILGEAAKATGLADQLMKENIYTTAFSYPVVPKEKARIRLQISAAHIEADLEQVAQKITEILNRL